MSHGSTARRPPFFPKTYRQKVSVLIATFFGAGFLPKAPGTWGTVAALPLFWGVAGESLVTKLIILFFILLFGTMASAEVQKMSGCGDHQSIVIDEVLGVGITLLLIPQDWKLFLTATILFRFFDIVKVAPVNWVDAWSKNKGKDPIFGGFGVMADDLIAGIQGFIVIEAIRFYLINKS
jgi:phosphatidylglycerophosphatase A